MNRVLIFTFLFCISAGLWADNEEQLVYGWTYDAEGNLGVKVTAGNATTGNVVIPATKWDYPVIEIGAAAFKSNNAITSVTLPNSVRVIGDEAFWSCANLQSATLGNSLTSIGNLAFQYCKSLKSISLPNTLASVGDHFLCSCNQLTTLVVPENLTTIGEYFLHGCENIRTVVLLGDKPRTLGKYPFVSQDQQNMKQVNNCVFYVANQDVYESIYKNGENWKYADAENTERQGDDGWYQNGGNRYAWQTLPDNVRPYEAQWITACYPNDIDVKAVFGDLAMAAEMTAAAYKGLDTEGNHLYHLDFTLVKDGKMLANRPYLLKVDPKYIGSAYIVDHSESSALLTDKELSVCTNISNQEEDKSALLTQITMSGTYQSGGRNLNTGEFLFSNSGGKLRFYKQAGGGKQRHMGAYRCYWQIIKDHQPVSNGKLGTTDAQTTDIRTEIFIRDAQNKQVFNLRGESVGTVRERVRHLPSGIYVINGKKHIVR